MNFTGGRMSKPVSILIPTRRAFEAIELTVESILARTWYDNFRIVVCDNSHGGGVGNRLEYLKGHERNGTIRLIENEMETGTWEQRPDGMSTNRYGHGENLKILLRACETDYAMLLSSGIEILKTDWLDVLLSKLRTEKDIGAARLKPAVNHFDVSWRAPVWWPNIMLLDMRLYRKFGADDDWDLSRIPFDAFPHKHLFDGQAPPKTPDPEGLTVFLDTGYNFWRRLEYENPEGYQMVNLDTNPCTLQWTQMFGLYIGLDRNSHRPEHPFVVGQRANIKERLRTLRCQN